MEIDWYFISVIIFAFLIVLALYKDRKNVERSSVMLLRRTENGKKTIKRIANISPRFWRWLGNFGIVLGFAVSIYIFFYMLESLVKGIISEKAVSTLSVVIPSISSTTAMGPGYLAVPFWYWIISIALLVVVHEGFHGIMTINGKTKIKSLGWGVIAILPLAFVEPDEKALAKKSLSVRLRVYAAGSLANFIFAVIYIALFSGLAASIFMAGGAAYQGTIKGYPAYEANMTGAITEINGYKISNAQDLTNALEISGENKTLIILTKNGTDNFTYEIESVPYPDRIEFKPDWSTNVIIGFEANFPGTIDFISSFSSLLQGAPIKSWASLNYEKEFWDYAIITEPSIKIHASEKIAKIEKELEGRKSPGFIGIAGVSTFYELMPEYKNIEPLISFVQGLLFFLFILNFGVGLANLLPIVPLDGGKMWEDLFKEYVPKHANLIMKILSWTTFIIIIAGFVVPFLK